MTRNRPTLVCLHGFMGDQSDWNPLSDALAPGVQVVALDLPGQGGNELSDGASGSFESYCDEVQRQLLELDLPRPHLLGYSMGGRVALRLAVAHPNQFSSLILESASPGLTEQSERVRRCEIDAARADRLRRAGIHSFVDDWYEQSLFESMHRFPDRLAALKARRCRNDPQELARVIELMSPGRQPSLWPDLGSIQLPTFLIAGQRDSKYTDLAERMVEAVPVAHMALVPNAGHCVHWEQPGEFANRVREFLKG